MKTLPPALTPPLSFALSFFSASAFYFASIPVYVVLCSPVLTSFCWLLLLLLKLLIDFPSHFLVFFCTLFSPLLVQFSITSDGVQTLTWTWSIFLLVLLWYLTYLCTLVLMCVYIEPILFSTSHHIATYLFILYFYSLLLLFIISSLHAVMKERNLKRNCCFFRSSPWLYSSKAAHRIML